MNDIRTRAKTAATWDALREVQSEAGCLEQSTPHLNKAIREALICVEQAHACALDDSEESDRYKRHAEMIVVAKRYYTLLDAGKKPSVELSDKLDILLEPFSDDPAFTAFCQFKRAAAGLN